MHNGRKTNMNTRQPRPAASFAGGSKRWSSDAARPNRTALTTREETMNSIWRSPKLKPKRQHSRGRKLLPACRTFFQIDVLGQRSDIRDFAATIAVINSGLSRPFVSLLSSEPLSQPDDGRGLAALAEQAIGLAGDPDAQPASPSLTRTEADREWARVHLPLSSQTRHSPDCDK